MPRFEGDRAEDGCLDFFEEEEGFEEDSEPGEDRAVRAKKRKRSSQQNFSEEPGHVNLESWVTLNARSEHLGRGVGEKTNVSDETKETSHVDRCEDR